MQFVNEVWAAIGPFFAAIDWNGIFSAIMLVVAYRIKVIVQTWVAQRTLHSSYETAAATVAKKVATGVMPQEEAIDQMRSYSKVSSPGANNFLKPSRTVEAILATAKLTKAIAEIRK